MRGRRSEHLIGRERELTLLEELVSEVRAGDPRVVLIEGEPGIGKTRMAMEATRRLRTAGDLVISGHGIDLSGGDLAYGVVAELLRDLVRQLGVEQVRAALGRHSDALLSLLTNAAGPQLPPPAALASPAPAGTRSRQGQ